MLDNVERFYVETVGMADSIELVLNRGTSDEVTLKFLKNEDFKKLRHDLRLVIQDHFRARQRRADSRRSLYV